MAINVYPAPTGGGIKSVQRGVATSATSITIVSVDVSKSFVNTFSTASSGDSNAGVSQYNSQNQANGLYGTGYAFSNNLVAVTYGAYLSNSTTLVTTGPCRWEVVEFA